MIGLAKFAKIVAGAGIAFICILVHAPSARAGFDDQIYILTLDGNSIQVFDKATDTIVETIKVGGFPHWMAIHLPSRIGVVANQRSGTVTIIDLAARKEIKTIEVGQAPHWVVFNSKGDKVYISNVRSNTVSVVNTAKWEKINDIAVGNKPDDLLLSPDGKLLFVTNFGSNNVSVIDTEKDVIVTTIGTGEGPHWLGGKWPYIFVSHEGSTGISVINGLTLERIWHSQEGTTPHYVSASPTQSYVYVANRGSDSISVYAAADPPSLITTVPVGIQPDEVIEVEGYNKLYVSNLKDSAISVVDMTSWKEIKRIVVGNRPHTILIDKSKKKAYISNMESNTVSIVDLETDRVINEVRTDGIPSHIINAEKQKKIK